MITVFQKMSWYRGSELIEDTVELASDVVLDGDDTVGAGTTKEFEIAFDVADLVWLHMVAEDGDLVMSTNAYSGGDDTFAMTQDSPAQWNNQNGLPNPFGTNVTSIFAINNGSGTARFRFRAGANGTNSGTTTTTTT